MGQAGSGARYGKTNEYTDYYVQDGYWINNILRSGEQLFENDKEYIKGLDEATTGTVTEDTLYRVVDASTIFEGIDDFDYADLRAHILLGDEAYDNGAYSQNKKKIAQERINSVIGKKLIDKGFMSTTTDEATANHKMHDDTHGRNKIILKLTGTKGAKGADLSGYDKKNNFETIEKETLLARGYGYEYKKIYAKNKEVYVEARLIKK